MLQNKSNLTDSNVKYPSGQMGEFSVYVCMLVLINSFVCLHGSTVINFNNILYDL